MHHHHHEVEGTDVEEYEILVSNTMSIYNLNTGRWIPQQCTYLVLFSVIVVKF